MKVPSHIVGPAASAIACSRVFASGLLSLSLLLIAVSSASALPSISYSNCPSNWANNPGALACEQKGEQDISNGVTANHYVACGTDGTIYCCTGGGSNGALDCEEVTAQTLGTRSPLQDAQSSVQFGGLQISNTLLNQIQQEVQDMKTKVDSLYTQQCPSQIP